MSDSIPIPVAQKPISTSIKIKQVVVRAPRAFLDLYLRLASGTTQLHENGDLGPIVVSESPEPRPLDPSSAS